MFDDVGRSCWNDDDDDDDVDDVDDGFRRSMIES